jgi:hypothetical protein
MALGDKQRRKKSDTRVFRFIAIKFNGMGTTTPAVGIFGRADLSAQRKSVLAAIRKL